MTGALVLAQVAAQTASLEVACRRCERRGRYEMARLLARHGAGMAMPDLRRVLAGDCPRWALVSDFDRCGVHFPELPELFRRG